MRKFFDIVSVWNFTLVLESELSNVLETYTRAVTSKSIDLKKKKPNPIIRTGVRVPNVQKCVMVSTFTIYYYFVNFQIFCYIVFYFKIQIYFANSTTSAPYRLPMRRCGTPCTLDRFVKITRHLIPHNWNAECQQKKWINGSIICKLEILDERINVSFVRILNFAHFLLFCYIFRQIRKTLKKKTLGKSQKMTLTFSHYLELGTKPLQNCIL